MASTEYCLKCKATRQYWSEHRETANHKVKSSEEGHYGKQELKPETNKQKNQPRYIDIIIKHIYLFVFLVYLLIYGASHMVQLVKNLPANAGATRNLGLIPRLGRSPGVGNGNSLKYSCLQNAMDRGAW